MENRRPVASVVIPAHDEEQVLGRCLSTLVRGARPGELEVVVVANACADATAEVARRHGVLVIETRTPGKANAIRLGDAAASSFPRLYLDADVELTVDSVRALAETLSAPGVLATSPVPRFDMSGATTTARRLHSVHELMMAGRRGLAGAGAYCVDEAGHARVFPLPDVISDDGFVHRSFAAHEQVVSRGASSLVRPAPTFAACLRRRIRVRQGNRQLDALGLALPAGPLRLGSLARLVRTRQIAPMDAVCYLGLVGADRLLVRWRTVRRAEVAWGTDVLSRRAGPADLVRGQSKWLG